MRAGAVVEASGRRLSSTGARAYERAHAAHHNAWIRGSPARLARHRAAPRRKTSGLEDDWYDKLTASFEEAARLECQVEALPGAVGHAEPH